MFCAISLWLHLWSLRPLSRPASIWSHCSPSTPGVFLYLYCCGVLHNLHSLGKVVLPNLLLFLPFFHARWASSWSAGAQAKSCQFYPPCFQLGTILRCCGSGSRLGQFTQLHVQACRPSSRAFICLSLKPGLKPVAPGIPSKKDLKSPMPAIRFHPWPP